MNLSKAQPPLRRRPSRHQGGEQAWQQRAHVEAAVEAVLELGEVAVRVLGEGEGVVGAGDGRLQVAQQRRPLRAPRFRFLFFPWVL